MWAWIALAPSSIGGWLAGHVLAQAVGAPGVTDSILAPLGAAVPFAALAWYIIRRQERFIDLLTGELKRVNDETINKFVSAIAESTTLHRETTKLHEQQTRMWERVLEELQRRSPV